MLIGAKTYESMTAEQKQAYDEIASGPRKGVPYPFLSMLDAPHIAGAIQSVGAVIRFNSEMPGELREVAILAAAGAFPSEYEWQYHAKIARDMRIDEKVIAATRSGDVGQVDADTDRVTIQLVRRAVLERSVDQELLSRLVLLASRVMATEIVAIAGYYPLLALFLSAGQLEPQSSQD